MVARLVLRTAALAALSGCIGSGKQHAAPDASARGPAASAPPPAPTPPPAANTQPGIDGKALYERYCDFCHGKEGQGYAADEAPALANDVFLSIATDAYIHDAILKGRPGTTMSAWGKQKGGPLDGKDADAIVSYVRAWQKQAPVALTPREPKGDAARTTRRAGARLTSFRSRPKNMRVSGSRWVLVYAWCLRWCRFQSCVTKAVETS